VGLHENTEKNHHKQVGSSKKAYIASSCVVGHVKGRSHLGLSISLEHIGVRVEVVEDGRTAHKEQLQTNRAQHGIK
jgi:hypothetical protein